MKRLLFGIAFMLVAAPLAMAQVIVNPPGQGGASASGTASVAAATSTKAASSKKSPIQPLIDLERAFDTAYRTRNIADLNRMLSYDFISTDPTGKVWSKAELLKELAASKDESINTVVNDITQVNVYGGSAVVAGLISVKGNTPSGPLDLRLRYTNTFVKEKGKWEIAASQQTKVQQ
jgi:hypothetical protein